MSTYEAPYFLNGLGVVASAFIAQPNVIYPLRQLAMSYVKLLNLQMVPYLSQIGPSVLV